MTIAIIGPTTAEAGENVLELRRGASPPSSRLPLSYGVVRSTRITTAFT